jgi:hypothetical protein
MIGPVLPLEMYLFQAIFLFVAIALEARVFHRRLYLPRRTSVEYATSINLLATVIGWLAFFALQNLLPLSLKDQIISYIFFDRFLGSQPESFYLTLVSTGVVIFFCAFLIKLQGLQLLESLLERTPEHQSSLELQPPKLPHHRRRQRLSDRLEQTVSPSDPNQATAVLLANAYSHSAIALLLFLRFLSLYTLKL